MFLSTRVRVAQDYSLSPILPEEFFGPSHNTFNLGLQLGEQELRECLIPEIGRSSLPASSEDLVLSSSSPTLRPSSWKGPWPICSWASPSRSVSEVLQRHTFDDILRRSTCHNANIKKVGCCQLEISSEGNKMNTVCLTFKRVDVAKIQKGDCDILYWTVRPMFERGNVEHRR